MSKFLSLAKIDWLKGLIVAVLFVVVSSIYQLIEDKGTLPSLAELSIIGVFAIKAALAYLLKNVLTNSDGQMLKKETKVISDEGNN